MAIRTRIVEVATLDDARCIAEFSLRNDSDLTNYLIGLNKSGETGYQLMLQQVFISVGDAEFFGVGLDDGTSGGTWTGPGDGEFTVCVTGNKNKDIDAISDGGGGLITTTSIDHGLNVNDGVTFSGTIQYDDSYTVMEVVDSDNFKVTATFTATKTGIASYDVFDWSFNLDGNGSEIVASDVHTRNSLPINFAVTGVTFTFDEPSGHTVDDEWKFGVMEPLVCIL